MRRMESSQPSPDQDITQWLTQLDAGDALAVDGLFAAPYSEFKRGASARLRNEHAGHTLSAPLLTFGAGFRLGEQTRRARLHRELAS